MNKAARREFPHSKPGGPLRPVREFVINGKYLGLYAHEGRPASSCFSLYWEDENNPVQHAMSYGEVFNAIADLLEESDVKNRSIETAYLLLRQSLRITLDNIGMRSNPAVTDEWIVSRIRGLLSKKPQKENRRLIKKQIKKAVKKQG
ncbi:MAG: hypothetical protein Q8Q06_03930 [bacterium]|nr:hypothetical protein [bacterium]